ncbi:MAG: rod-binding protein [Lachnospiraceae bacterium]|nr:rod-binding protein [Lachnospiraceae bacterium]
MSFISDIGSSYASDLTSTALQQNNMRGIQSDYSKSSDDELMEACKSFEEYFVEQIFKGAQKTTVLDGFASETGSMGAMKSMIRDAYAQEIAKSATKQKTFGLAESMYEQMKRSQGHTLEEVDLIEAEKAAEAAAAKKSESSEESGSDKESEAAESSKEDV